jgi:small subunit ribosomal protein S4e
MTKDHLKRIATPKTWKVRRKEIKFITRPNPSGHALEYCMPINVVMRDLLNICTTNKEVKYVIKNKEVLINQRKVNDHKLAMGIFDTLSIEENKLYYIMNMNKKGKLHLSKIKKEDADKKLVKIIGKNKVKGKTQLNLNDGKNILVDDDKYKINDSLLIKLPKHEILEHLKFEKGSMIFLIKGRHIGHTGNLVDIKEKKIMFKNSAGKEMETLKDYAFVVGKNKHMIDIIKNE